MPQFTDARFMTAADKRRVLAQWTRFLLALHRSHGDKARCYRAFPEALYTHGTSTTTDAVWNTRF